MTETPKKRGRPKGSKTVRADGREKGAPLVKPLQEAKKAYIEKAEKIYRRYCRGMPGLEGAYAHVVKVIELEGGQVTIDQVRKWAKSNDWNGKVASLDAKVYGALEDVRARRRAITPSGRADLQALKETTDDLIDLAADLTAKAAASLEFVFAENVGEVVMLARTAKDIAESVMRVREALSRYVPAGMKQVEATSDGKAVQAEVLEPPPATQAAPSLDAAVASFEKAAREGRKH